jgi:hypothetical protein
MGTLRDHDERESLSLSAFAGESLGRLIESLLLPVLEQLAAAGTSEPEPNP